LDVAKKHIEIIISKYSEFFLFRVEYIKFLYEAIKDYNLAYKECKKFLQDYPDNPTVNFIAGDILYRIGKKRIAAGYYGKYLTNRNDKNSYWEYRAVRGLYEAYMERGDYERAKLYERWIKPRNQKNEG